MNKPIIAVIFGGQSSEHEVSCRSAFNVIGCMNTDRYDLALIGITKEGEWLLAEKPADLLDGTWLKSRTHAIISPDASAKCILLEDEEGIRRIHPQVIFPVLHGHNGEDGTIQGLFELSGIPYVGCGVFASAAAFDKAYTKVIVDALGIRQAAFELVLAEQLEEDAAGVIARIENRFSYPVFIKPSREGSSCGVSKAADRQELEAGLKVAVKHDRKVLVEEMIVGREIECAVLGGNGKTKASGVGEILAAADFYDYDAKYNNPQSLTVVGPELPAGAAEEVRESAVKIFDAMDGFGLSRVDFFVKEDGTVIFNEINTLPGFTDISMYPMLWKAAGIPGDELIQKLIDLAFTR